MGMDNITQKGYHCNSLLARMGAAQGHNGRAASLPEVQVSLLEQATQSSRPKRADRSLESLAERGGFEPPSLYVQAPRLRFCRPPPYRVQASLRSYGPGEENASTTLSPHSVLDYPNVEQIRVILSALSI